MKALSNKEIYLLLKLLNDKQANLELDKHFSLSEIERIQQEISITENKSPQEVFTIENLSKRMYGMKIQTGYRVSSVDRDSIIDYSSKYVEALIKNDLTGLTDSNKLSVLIEEFSSTIKDKSNLTEYKLNELRYIPVVLFAYTNQLIKIKSIIHNKYKLSTNDIIGNGALFDDVSPKTIATFSMGLEFDMSIADEHTLNDLNSLMDKFNEIIKRPCIVSSEFKKNNKQLSSIKKPSPAKPTKIRRRFSQKIQILYNQIKKLAKSRGYQISPVDLIDTDGEMGLPTSMDNLTSALNRLNEQYREIVNDENATITTYDRTLETYLITPVWENN